MSNKTRFTTNVFVMKLLDVERDPPYPSHVVTTYKAREVTTQYYSGSLKSLKKELKEATISGVNMHPEGHYIVVVLHRNIPVWVIRYDL